MFPQDPDSYHLDGVPPSMAAWLTASISPGSEGVTTADEVQLRTLRPSSGSNSSGPNSQPKRVDREADGNDLIFSSRGRKNEKGRARTRWKVERKAGKQCAGTAASLHMKQTIMVLFADTRDRMDTTSERDSHERFLAGL